MNIVGKILVILNLAFALIVGGFLIVDFATRTNWRKEYESLKKEMDVARQVVDTGGGTLTRITADVKKANQERDTARLELADAQLLNKAQEASWKMKLDESDQRFKNADLTTQAALAEKERFSKENQSLLVVLKQRDDVIVKQQADIVTFRNAAVAQESAYKAANERLTQALERIAEMERSYAKKGGPGAPGAPGAPEPTARNQSNPPPVYVAAKIDSIHPEDKTLVQLDAGSDKGLAKGHTLEAFRLNPPLYLGMIRIVEVTPHTAFGRLERSGTANRTPLRPGDGVASSLTRN